MNMMHVSFVVRYDPMSRKVGCKCNSKQTIDMVVVLQHFVMKVNKMSPVYLSSNNHDHEIDVPDL